MRIQVIGLAGLLALTGAFSARAQPARGLRAGLRNPAALQQRLGLSDEQAAQLRKLWSDERKESIRRRADIQVARLELNEALEAAKVDEGVVAAKAKVLAELESAAVRARVDRQLALRKVLTSEQYVKLKEFRSQRRMARDERRGTRGERRAPGRQWRHRPPAQPTAPAPPAGNAPGADTGGAR